MLHETDFEELSMRGTAQTADDVPQWSSLILSLFIIPHETVRLHPKLQARKISNNSRRKEQTRTLIDTAENIII